MDPHGGVRNARPRSRIAVLRPSARSKQQTDPHVHGYATRGGRRSPATIVNLGIFAGVEKKVACAANDGVTRNGSKLRHRGPFLAHLRAVPRRSHPTARRTATRPSSGWFREWNDSFATRPPLFRGGEARANRTSKDVGRVTINASRGTSSLGSFSTIDAASQACSKPERTRVC
jgi:hypothetical protein